MKKILIVTAFLLAGTNAAMAESNNAAEFNFNSVDANADGFISTEEATVSDRLANQFALLDLDQDGMLTESEFSKFGSLHQ